MRLGLPSALITDYSLKTATTNRELKDEQFEHENEPEHEDDCTTANR